MSHFSTAPPTVEGLMRVLRGTSSPSADTMPLMSPLSWNCSLSMPASSAGHSVLLIDWSHAPSEGLMVVDVPANACSKCNSVQKLCLRH